MVTAQLTHDLPARVYSLREEADFTAGYTFAGHSFPLDTLVAAARSYEDAGRQ